MSEFKVYNGPTGRLKREESGDCAKEAQAIGRAYVVARVGLLAGLTPEHDFALGYDGSTRQCRVCVRFERRIA